MVSLSLYTEMVVIGCGHNFMSNNIFLSYCASLPTTTKAINFDSMVEWKIQVCILDAYEISPPPRVNIKPDVDLLSLTLVIQLASK